MAEPLDVLVVGAGSIGRRHLSNLLLIAEKVPLRPAVVEPNPEAREAACRGRAVSGYDSIEAAFSDKTFKAAIVCTPNHLHTAQTKRLLERGCHVFVEKPLAPSRQEAGELVPTVDRSGKFLMVGCNLRFHVGVRTLARALHEGSIGQPLSVRAHFGHYLPNWRPDADYRLTYSARRDQGGGILRDAVHEPDYLCWLFGRVDSVMGWLCNLSDLQLEVEDTAVYFMRQGPVLSEVHVDFLRRDKSRGCEIIGTDGTLHWQSTGKNPEKVSVRMFQAAMGQWESLFEEPAYNPNHQYVEEITYFIKGVTEGSRPMNGIEEALHVLEVLDGVQKSTLLGERVTIG